MENEKERELRDRIFDLSSLLPGFTEPVAVAKEIPVRRAGSADVVLVNAKGEVAIVECKRATNPECRRWVIGQVFEYAAGLWKIDDEDFRRILAARGTVGDGWEDEAFRGRLRRNLKDGRFRLFIAVDEMTDRLQKRLHRTVTFLNSNLSEAEVVVAEVPRLGQVEIYGDDPESIPPLKPKLGPDRSTLIDEIGSSMGVAVAEALMGWADDLASRGVEVHPMSTQCVIEASGKRLFRLRADGIQVALSAVITKGQPWPPRTAELVKRLERLGFRLRGNRPRAPLEVLADDEALAEFLTLMEGHLAAMSE